MDPVFWELHSGIAHEAPGGRAETLRALGLTGVTGPASVLEVACGPGEAVVALLDVLPEAEVVAFDRHPPFVDRARARLEAAGHGGRARVIAADMGDLPDLGGPFDLIWCEGAAYIRGVRKALAD